MARKEYTEVYRDHTIQFFVSKTDDSDLWNANGRVEFPDVPSIRSVNLTGHSQTFATEEDAIRDFLNIGMIQSAVNFNSQRPIL